MPDITYEYSLDMLTVDSVSVYKKTFITISEDAPAQQVGRPVRTSYSNSPSGRSAVVAELPENFAYGILAVWGDNPTVPDPPEPLPIDPRSEGEAEVR